MDKYAGPALFLGIGGSALYLYLTKLPPNPKGSGGPPERTPEYANAYELPGLPFEAEDNKTPSTLTDQEATYDYEMQRFLLYGGLGMGNNYDVAYIIDQIPASRKDAFSADDLKKLETAAQFYYCTSYADPNDVENTVWKDWDNWSQSPTGKDYLSKIWAFEHNRQCIAQNTQGQSGIDACNAQYQVVPFKTPTTSGITYSQGATKGQQTCSQLGFKL